MGSIKDFIIKIFIGVSIAAITGASAAYIKVYVMENDITWIKSSLTRIEDRLGTKKHGNL